MCSKRHYNACFQKILHYNSRIRVMSYDMWKTLTDEQQEWVKLEFLEFPGAPPLSHLCNLIRYAANDYDYVEPPVDAPLVVWKSHRELGSVYAPPSYMTRRMLV